MDYIELGTKDTSNMTDSQRKELGKDIIVSLKNRENEIENIHSEMEILFSKLVELGLQDEWTGGDIW